MTKKFPTRFIKLGRYDEEAISSISWLLGPLWGGLLVGEYPFQVIEK